jgi:hypothetical protein
MRFTPSYITPQTKDKTMTRFTDYELIAIENAYEELLIILEEQGVYINLRAAINEAVYMYDLDSKMEKELIKMYTTNNNTKIKNHIGFMNH